jgi:hypothetical protein
MQEHGPLPWGDVMKTNPGANTGEWALIEVGGGVPLETFAVVYHAIVEREQVQAHLEGRDIRFYPHALGWRYKEPYVLGLVLGAETTLNWQWLRLADLESATARKTDWLTCPPETRPQADQFLTETYVELT